MNFSPDDRQGAGQYWKFTKRGNTSRFSEFPRLSALLAWLRRLQASDGLKLERILRKLRSNYSLKMSPDFSVWLACLVTMPHGLN